MILSWSFLVLALVGVDGQQPGPPRGAGSSATRPAWPADQRRSGFALIQEVYDNLCPEGLLDELTVAAQARASSARLSARAADVHAEPSDSCYGCLPRSMPKVAAPRTMHQPEEVEAWPMTLGDAIWIALDNSEIVRVISCGMTGRPVGDPEPTAIKTASDRARSRSSRAPIVITRLDADVSSWRLKAEVMAHVRSVEQQYWNLAQAHVQFWAADRAVGLAREILDREQAELLVGRGTVADFAEAAQRLEQFNLDLVTRTSDVITIERQLRNLLGLPPADNRRIIPASPATEARLEPDWDSSLSEMLAHQPDVVQQRGLVRLAELGLVIARNQLLPVLGPDALHELQALGSQFDGPEIFSGVMVLKSLLKLAKDQEQETASAAMGGSARDFLSCQRGYTFQMPLATGRYPLANARSAQYVLLRSRAYYQQVVHQTTHSLARYFLEVDANYKQFRTASRMRQAAAQRLDAQRACYEEGRIAVDRYLDAISQYCTAVATEVRYKTTYNISIVALEEAKGTLLAYDDIVVAEAPRPSRPAPVRPAGADLATPGSVKSDRLVKTASLVDEPKDMVASAKKAPASRDAPRDATPPKTRTWTFSVSIGRTNPCQIKGTITSSEGTPAPGAP